MEMLKKRRQKEKSRFPNITGSPFHDKSKSLYGIYCLSITPITIFWPYPSCSSAGLPACFSACSHSRLLCDPLLLHPADTRGARRGGVLSLQALPAVSETYSIFWKLRFPIRKAFPIFQWFPEGRFSILVNMLLLGFIAFSLPI